MSDHVSKRKLLIGTGPMARAYARVLQALQVDFAVVGRGEASAKAFEQEVGVAPATGGLQQFLAEHTSAGFDQAIIATGTEMLADATLSLAKWGIKEILVEKPGGRSIEEVTGLAASPVLQDSRVFIAYNRRFYASVQRLQEIVREDGGVLSFNFEFTEWSHVITPLVKPAGVKENWFFANSTHVIDTAFFLGGKPVNMTSFATGGLDWHAVSVFSGAGISSRGALFSYQANWEAPGRWGVEILTSRHRLYLRPMEKLQIQKKGSVEVAPVELDDQLDTAFKPGIYRQTAAFVGKEYAQLVTLEEHAENCRYYALMLSNSSL